ncbi:aminotransferase class V-fold PLP-dependent enzyme [Nereida sp. MMG025]|uniref:aminotransferase class V-fold PLP-dependent enzyme n=1 Tax=Nereida sp. MMG025 TaxID=2909981 RepID=UPI001F16F3EE|nr:aminotransferase class V-fold PLP-dependent enzyme [Nereida sp. MMG025]MCF6443424.1 aminotransferase class V-fold PLP-dependent enzyme [Nereida sp. MMG025]
MQLDTDFIRAQFPAFAEPSLRNLAFFENAGGSFTCRHVAWRLSRFYRERKVQPYAPYKASFLAGNEMDDARTRLARMFGVASDEVSFGPSTSQNTYVLAKAFGEWLSPGQAIIVTEQDHEANAGVWRRLEDRGIEIREWTIDPETGALDIDDLHDLIDDNVKLLCFPHCSNVVGQINDVAAICKIARDASIFTCVDGVSYAPHGFPNVGKLGCDIYLFSAYKTYGPHQGIMLIRRPLGMALPGQGHYFNNDTLHKRFTPAGPDHAQVAACAGMADYIDAVYAHHRKEGRDGAGRAAVVADMMQNAEAALLEPLMDYLRTRSDLRIIGPQTHKGRAPTVALALKTPGEEMAEALSHHGIMAGGGDFYARRSLDAMGVDPDKGVLRLSFVHYTTPAEVDLLIRALDQTL